MLTPQERVVEVACGREHTVCCTSSGAMFSWGWGEAGRLGLGEVGSILSPQRVSVVRSFARSIEPKENTSGSKKRWGQKLLGDFGGGPLLFDENSLPPPPDEDVHVTSVACGREHTLCISSVGELFTCGAGDYGQLGLGHLKTVHTMSKVTLSSANSRCVSASGGDLHSAIVTADGSAM